MFSPEAEDAMTSFVTSLAMRPEVVVARLNKQLVTHGFELVIVYKDEHKPVCHTWSPEEVREGEYELNVAE